MKQILIIANVFHASPRIPGLAAFLTEFGWESSIVTPPLGNNKAEQFGFPRSFLANNKIIDAPYRGDVFWLWRKLFQILGLKTNESMTEQIKEKVGVASKRTFVDLMMKWYQTVFAYPDTEKTWTSSALKASYAAIKKEHFDAILSSSPFPTSHIVAARLKAKTGLPWVADFRDPWTQNHNYQFSKLRKYFEEKKEQKILNLADAIIAATPAYATKQELLHKMHVDTITNGFDPANLDNSLTPLAAKFTVTYTGAIYSGKQDPRKILRAFVSLISHGNMDPRDIEVRFYGPPLQWLKIMIAELKLQDIVKYYGNVPRTEALKKQKVSHVLLLMNWEDSTQSGVYPSKIFEYLSAQRPILATGGFLGDDIENIVRDTRAGVYAVTENQIEEALLRFYNEYKQTGSVSYHGDINEISKYSYREMANKLARRLDVITSEPKKE
jgi:glycosyltransferase involved in cell wall biosynthesis